MASNCDCGAFWRHRPWCASLLVPEAPRPRKDRGPGVVPVEPFSEARGRAQKGRAMKAVGKPLKRAPGVWDIPPGHECVQRNGAYVIQEAKQKPWESDKDFSRRKSAAHGENI